MHILGHSEYIHTFEDSEAPVSQKTFSILIFGATVSGPHTVLSIEERVKKSLIFWGQFKLDTKPTAMI